MIDQETELSDIEEFDRVGRALLETDDERATWCVRPGVTFQGIEVFLGERVLSIALGAIRSRRLIGQLEMWICKLLQDLRSKRTIVKCPACGASREHYRVRDLGREVHKALWDSIKKNGRLKLGIPSSHSDYIQEIKIMQDYINESCHKAEKTERILDKNVSDLPVKSAVRKALLEAGINTVRDICSWTKERVIALPGMGQVGFNTLRYEMERLGIQFAKDESLESEDAE